LLPTLEPSVLCKYAGSVAGTSSRGYRPARLAHVPCRQDPASNPDGPTLRTANSPTATSPTTFRGVWGPRCGNGKPPSPFTHRPKRSPTDSRQPSAYGRSTTTRVCSRWEPTGLTSSRSTSGCSRSTSRYVSRPSSSSICESCPRATREREGMTPILRFAALAGIRVEGVACADAATRDLARVGPYECP